VFVFSILTTDFPGSLHHSKTVGGLWLMLQNGGVALEHEEFIVTTGGEMRAVLS
jgi:hypothetical protein